MTEKEKYKQAFKVLHASENICMEEKRTGVKKELRPGRRLIAICACAMLILGTGMTALAFGGQQIGLIKGWGSNFEVSLGRDENGEETVEAMLHTDNLTEPVEIRNGRIMFIVNGEETDITESISTEKAYRYEYTDEEGYKHIWLVGLNSEAEGNYGYAEYIKDAEDKWITGYSARVNTNADGSTEAQWLELAKDELNIPW